MLDITFLGTSASAPTKERGMPSIALRYDGKVYLFDCGEGTQRSMMQNGVSYGSVSAIFLSHLHLDHYLGVFGFMETMKLSFPSPPKINILAPKDFSAMYATAPEFVTIKELKKGEVYKARNFSVFATRVKHTASAFAFVFQENEKIKFHEEKAHSLGMKGKDFRAIQEKGHVTLAGKKISLKDVSFVKPGLKIAYSGDCAPSDTLIEAAKGCDIIIHEATFGKEHEKEAKERLHSTAEQAAKVAKAAGAKKLILTHISPRYSKDASSLLEEARAIFPNTMIAQDGVNLRL